MILQDGGKINPILTIFNRSMT